MYSTNQKTLNHLKSVIKSDRVIKIALYAVGALISLYILGKGLSAMATAIRGMKDLKSAFDGK